MSCFETILFRHAGFPGAANMPLGTLSLPFWGQPNPGHPLRAFTRKRPLPPLLQRPPGVQERLQQNGAVIHRHAARLFDTEGFLL